MPGFAVSQEEVEAIARAALGTDRIRLERVATGFGNANWRVSDAAGRGYVVKVGPIASATKWGSARRAHELAAAVGVPLPDLVSFDLYDDHVVRVYEWVDGRTPDEIKDDRACVATLFASLGTAVAALHSVELEGFSSRLDESAPSFRRWADYVDHRLQQIRDRFGEEPALDGATLDRACETIGELAAEVGDAARPTLCHRDLHTDNLVVDERGALLAVLDWDMAEAWDPAGEWFKLDWLLFPNFPGAEAVFNSAYHALHPEPALWAPRKKLVDLMETLNTVANATIQGWGADFEARARSRLQALLARSD